MFINGLLSFIQYTYLFLLADNSKLLQNIKRKNEDIVNLQNDNSNLGKWCEKNYLLTLNINECEFIRYT